jgi:hypothetical protein
MLLVSIARILYCFFYPSSLGHLGALSLLRCFDGSLRLLAWFYHLIPQCSLLRCNARFFDAPTPRFDASMPQLSHARFLDASTSRFDASMPRFDTCFDPGFDNRSKRLTGTLLSSRRNSLKYLKASSLASMRLVSIAGIQYCSFKPSSLGDLGALSLLRCLASISIARTRHCSFYPSSLGDLGALSLFRCLASMLRYLGSILAPLLWSLR